MPMGPGNSNRHTIGNALYEWMGYDAQAQPTTTNFADYLLTTATEVPNIDVKLAEYRRSTRLGIGESGCVPAAAAIVSAIEARHRPSILLSRNTL